jgi:hypothetical protein
MTGLHMLMIGDSLMRYQYVTLVYYLHTGHWIHDGASKHIWETADEAIARYKENAICECFVGTEWKKSRVGNQYFIKNAVTNCISYFEKMGSFGLRGYRNASDINAWSRSTDKNGTQPNLTPSLAGYRRNAPDINAWSQSEQSRRRKVQLAVLRIRVVLEKFCGFFGAPTKGGHH